MPFSKDVRFIFDLPETWSEVEDGDNSTYGFAKKENGVGAFQITVSKKENTHDSTKMECANRLRELLGRQDITPIIETTKIKGGCMVHTQTVAGGRFFAYWFLSGSTQTAFLTYNCLLGSQNHELFQVEKIVNSFEFVD